MKNKLIMHTKLCLQETFMYILLASRLIRFTFFFFFPLHMSIMPLECAAW